MHIIASTNISTIHCGPCRPRGVHKGQFHGRNAPFAPRSFAGTARALMPCPGAVSTHLALISDRQGCAVGDDHFASQKARPRY